MARRLRLPWIADLLLVSEPGEIRALADHAALDRSFGRGPLLNRLIGGRAAAALRHGGAPLPSARLRDDAERRRLAAALAERLAAAPPDGAALDAMAAHVRGAGGRPAGKLAQEALGRAFVRDYRATPETWAAAAALEAHLRSWNPLARLAAALGGRLGAAQRRLGRAVEGDAAGVHATGIAVHNLVESLARMRADFADATLRARLSPEAAATRALAAPLTVIRAADRAAEAPGGGLRPGTLVALSLRRAADRTLDAELAFLSTSWSRCPADRWTRDLLRETWARATKEAEG